MARNLIADDEDLERRALGLILSEASVGEAFRSRRLKNGPEALSLGLSGDFDVIILDVKMPAWMASPWRRPEKSQYSVGYRHSLGVRYLRIRAKSLRLGVYEYLLKPASRKEVVRALLRSLELQRAPESLANSGANPFRPYRRPGKN
jgi:two-component system response regulator YesN